MRTLALLAGALLLAGSAAAAPSLESLKFHASDALSQPMAVAHFARRPRVGTMTGGFGGAPVQLTFDRVSWTIKGGVNGTPVDLTIDHDAKTVKGGAGGLPVDLTFDWSPERVSYSGAVSYTVDWQAGTLQGDGLDLTFSLQDGTVSGGAWGYPVQLTLDAASGRLTGGMNGAPVDATLVNMDLSDLLQYVFVLRKPAVAAQ